MKKLNTCIVENCIPTPSSCVTWNGGDIEALGICNGDSLNELTWEIVKKLEELGGEDISNFDIEALLDICNKKAPLEINLISILSLLRDNEVCLKDYIDTLNDKINELSGEGAVKVNLKCYADLDNLGNALSISRAELDQLVINELCDHKQRIQTIEGKLITIQNEINAIDPHAVVDELSFATCLDAVVKPTSVQVIKTATDLCALRDANGNQIEIAQALSLTPADWNSKFGLITGWDLSPDNWAQHYGNLLLVIDDLEKRIKYMEENCCALTCEDIKIGFSAVFNEDRDGIILTFNFGTGTQIPNNVEDLGSTGTITDMDGNVVSFNLTIANNYTIEIPIGGLNLLGDLEINLEPRMGIPDVLSCQKCISRIVKRPLCDFCEIKATGDVTIIYKVCPPGVSPTTTTTTTEPS